MAKLVLGEKVKLRWKEGIGEVIKVDGYLITVKWKYEGIDTYVESCLDRVVDNND